MIPRGVLPSFWDRLQRSESSRFASKTISVAEFENLVLHDIELLLNERRALDSELPRGLRTTILGYGLTELTAFELASQAGADNLALAIQTAIRDFEPRLRSVSVVAINSEDGPIFRIRAELYVEPALERLQFQAVVKGHSAGLEVRLPAAANSNA